MSSLEVVIAYFRANKCRKAALLTGILLLALTVRVLLFSSPSKDIVDFFGPWYDTFVRYGRDTALGMDFYNYSPPTLYLIDVMTVFTFIPRDAALRLMVVPFDFLAAWGIYKILKLQFKSESVGWAGLCAFLFLPAVIAGSAMWGQPDITYIAFLVWMAYFLMKGKNLLATVFFAVAFCFKLQALMVAPIFLIMMMRRKYPVYWLLVIPVVYFLSVVPAWIAGRRLVALLTVYFTQFQTYPVPSANAANPFIFLNSVMNTGLVTWIGLGVTAAAMLAYLAMRWFKWKDFSPKSLVYDFAFLTLLLPFLLPKMHDRYFLPAAVFLFILSFFDIKVFWAFLLNQLAILFSYVPYFTRWSNEWVHVGAVFNLAAVVWLLLCYREHMHQIEKAGTKE